VRAVDFRVGKKTKGRGADGVPNILQGEWGKRTTSTGEKVHDQRFERAIGQGRDGPMTKRSCTSCQVGK